MKIVITGGHASPAIALTDALMEYSKKEKTAVQIIFIGRKYTSIEEEDLSWEYQEIKKRNIPFYHLDAGRLTRYVSVQSAIHFFRIPMGFVAAYKILRKERPDVIMSFGGYLGLPVCLMGKILGIPYYSHEQTIQPGITNRILGSFAKKMFVAFPETLRYFNTSTTEVTGNLLRSSIFHSKSESFKLNKKLPVVYVTGGSLGSHSLNVHILHILNELLSFATVIHQTGNVQEFNDYYELMKYRDTLPKTLKERYILYEHVSDAQIGSVYSVADIVVGRAGANTFSELIALKKPAVFVPLPWSAHDEQQKHADFFRKSGLGEVFNQYDSSSELLSSIQKVLKELPQYRSNFDKLGSHYKKNAVNLVLHEITQDS